MYAVIYVRGDVVVELGSVYLTMQKSRRWDRKKVNYLPGAYRNAMRYMYGEKYVHVDLVKNQRSLLLRRAGEVVSYHSELV